LDNASQWPPLAYETLPWKRDAQELELVPKSRRRKILPTYEAAIPLQIACRDVNLPPGLARRLSELEVSLARFDALGAARGFDLPALLLRSESSSSSQIENLTSSIRNVAMAELSSNVPHNARLIANNLDAMRTALALDDELTADTMIKVQRMLIGDDESGIRDVQVWIGGTPYSPHGAVYVPPGVQRVDGCLDDLCAYARRDDVPPIVKAAIVHAQFETIHPFVDGNGRTGRTLLHNMLRREGVLGQTTLPVSAGLLHGIEAYLAALNSYHEGNPLAIIECVADALEVALVLGHRASVEIATIIESWRSQIVERSGSAIHRLPELLVEQPVVNASFVADRLSITPRAANDLIDRAVGYEILRRVGTARRGVFYQADALIDVLDDLSSAKGLYRPAP